MSGYAIRLAVQGDVPLLGAIERAAAGIFPPGSIPDAIRDDSTPQELLMEGVKNDALFIAARNDDGAPVGYALLRIVDGLALLAQTDVLPAYGRRGIGSALVRRTAARAGELGYEALYLTTFTHVPWNAPFYAKLGFISPAKENLPPAMRLILHAERAAGLEHRTAMRLALR